MMLDHEIPAKFEKFFLQTKSYMKLIKSIKYTAIQIHLSQIVHVIFSIHVNKALKTHCVQLIKDKTTYIVKRQVILLVKTFAKISKKITRV